MPSQYEQAHRCTLQLYIPRTQQWGLACDVPTQLSSTLPSALTEGATQVEVLLASDIATCEGFERVKPALYVSPWLVEVFTKQAQDMQSIICDPELIPEVDYQALVAQRLPHTLTESEYMAGIRRLRNQHMARIALRDLLGLARLEQTLSDLSNLAQACVASACAYARSVLAQRHGIPLSHEGRELDLMVLGMGKLGGGELNFSSDIDLMFFYPEQGQTNGEKSLDNQTYFVRLGQLIIKLLDTRTADGFVFRVDMRLRPFGDSGALAISTAAAEKYYQEQGREWERYAMIKACTLYGNDEDVEAFRSRINPFVYRRYLDFSAIQSLRELKKMIVLQVQKKGMQNNVKLGSGGIREIEFIAQAFQIIYGGKRAELQQRSLVNIFSALSEQSLLPADVVCELLDAYAFLRKAENRLQIMRDEQTHNLPDSDIERTRLAYSMGFEHWDAFEQVLKQHRATVDTQFKAVFAEEKTEQSECATLWFNFTREEDEDTTRALANTLELDAHGCDECVRLLQALKRASVFKQASEEAQSRLSALMPIFFEEVAQLNAGKIQAFKRGMDLIRAVLRRSNYLVLLYENRPALTRLLNLFAQSEWVAEQITTQPLLLDTLLDERQLLNVRDAQAMREELNQLIRLDTEEAVLEGMRQFKSMNTLSIAAVDLSGLMPLMKVSDHLTTCAEVLVQRTHELVWDNMVARNGVPRCLVNDGVGGDSGEKMVDTSMCVIGYGKLGGIELGYSSDLDIVFLHNSKKAKSYTTGRADGGGVIDNTLFFARLAQRFSSVMQTHTLGGQLYEVDTRLRPDGNSGEWVKSLEGFEHYQMNDAWTWEHQALVRARFISGEDALKTQFNAIRRRVLCQKRDLSTLHKEVVEMREKIRDSIQAEKAKHGGQCLNLKKDRGGLTDIEFMVQYSVLAYAHQHPSLTEYTDNIRILETMAKTGVMNAEDCAILIESYRQIRARIHRLALNKEKALVNDLGELAPVVQSVADIWHRFMATK